MTNFLITSNAPKSLNNVKNKISEGGELLYSKLPELPIIAKPNLTDKALNIEATISDIIPQKNNRSQVLDMNDSVFKTIKC